ncbi:hypothetical protein Rsub_13124 [Raphidocelis subcapitata]|uniref:Guanine nucleotide-binding protein-like 1 n=1 Tax=Raphidocelis subcapitata TaxID=307507 RepID=A0A2V0PKN8_9CHLO|nr:hypothetical protein Rsub_13124 [Raphidocelis subcapitata]|eukprot:GBG00365.1 hypothetical protein Rsub_13124 [Raphidocelis subcapitata]
MAPKRGGGGGRGRGRGRRGGAGAGGAAAAGDGAPSWRRPAGGLSAASKKEYLQWKRRQKAERAEEEAAEEGAERAALEGGSVPAGPSRGGGAHEGRGSAAEGSGSSSGDDGSGSGDDSGSGDASDASDASGSGGSGAERGAAAPASAQQRARAADAAAAREHAADARNTPPSAADMEAPLQYRPLEAVGAASPGDGRDGGRAAPAARMVRLSEAEVNQTEEGASLGMPTRPAWQGVVRSAEQLNQLEEAEFEAWRDGLERRFGARGAGRLSFYETRLEFWRQLWRTLEMSDAVVIIVDARNPLLHFPEALYRHAGRALGRPLLLLLNKSDLVPPAASAAWAAWFEGRYPGLRALPVSAAPGSAAATQRAVLGALLELRIERGGQQARIGDVVGLSLDELISESLRRNTHAKRRIIGAARAGTGGAAPGDGGSEGEGEWSIKGTKAARKDAQRRKRRARRGGHGRGGAGADGDGDDASGGESDEGGEGSEQEAEEEGEEEEEEEEERLLREGVEALTLEGRLASLTDASLTRASGAGSGAAAALAAAAAAAPVCCGLVGEPNVGKSSTLNALLGSHRVAVSSHPGRTKHYQTHYLARRLSAAFLLCDCPGLVFPRLDVSLPMQVLFGSFPIAHCRDPYSVVRYMAERIWPRLQDSLRLAPRGAQSEAGRAHPEAGRSGEGAGAGEWTPLALCEALCERHNWRSRRGGRLDVYRAANWLLRGALAGRDGLVLAFLPPAAGGGCSGAASAAHE